MTHLLAGKPCEKLEPVLLEGQTWGAQIVAMLTVDEARLSPLMTLVWEDKQRSNCSCFPSTYSLFSVYSVTEQL